MSFFDGGFFMIVIFCITIIGHAYWLGRGPHTKKASSIQSESPGQDEDDCEWLPDDDDKKYPLGIYGLEREPTPSPNVSITVDVINVQ